MIEHLIGPTVGASVNIIKELIKTKSATNLSEQQIETSKRILRLEITNVIHSLILGRLLEAFKGDSEKGFGAVVSVAAVYGLFTTLLKESLTQELQAVKGVKQDQIDRSVQEFMDLIKSEADKMTNIIKSSTGIN